jgi:hypothetical protein
MPTLSELVKIDFDEEVKIINEAGGRLWPKMLGLTIVCCFIWGLGLFLGKPWDESDIWIAISIVIGMPFLERAWERYQVAALMRHEREVRVELKLDVLLGLVHVEDVDRDF